MMHLFRLNVWSPVVFFSSCLAGTTFEHTAHKHHNFVLCVNASEKSKPAHFMCCLPHKTVYIIHQDTTECAFERGNV